MFLYLRKQGTKLSKIGGYFILNKIDGTEEDEKYPIGLVEGIFIFGKIHLTTSFIRECLKEKIPVFFLSIYGQLFGKLDSLEIKNVEILYLQSKISQDERISFYYAKIFIINKVRNSVSMIRRWLRLYYKEQLSKDELKEIEKQINKIKIIFEKIVSLKKNKDILRAYEGMVAEIYFKIYNYFLPAGFKINGRNKRPPKDKTNVLLSLGYTFLSQTIHILLEIYSLHPQFGFFHKPKSLKTLLVLDYMEMFRSWIIDDFVLYLLRNNIIRESDFIIKKDDNKNPIYLNNVAMNIFIANYGKKFFMKENLKIIKKIEKDILILKKSIREGKYIEYKGFNLNVN